MQAINLSGIKGFPNFEPNCPRFGFQVAGSSRLIHKEKSLSNLFGRKCTRSTANGFNSRIRNIRLRYSDDDWLHFSFESNLIAENISSENDEIKGDFDDSILADSSEDEVVDVSKFEFLESLMPKEEIGVKEFLEDHPTCDGRGVIIAILDSGVDPAAVGLQVTSDGKPKILNILDCTGSGDVDTSKVVQVDENGTIESLSGAKLQINREWKNSSGKWHIGCKRVFELFEGSLVKRLKVERKKAWDSKQRLLETEAIRLLHEFEKENGKSPSTLELKKQQEELQCRVELLKKMESAYEDLGPVVDVIAWHDGNHWRAALDTRQLYSEEHKSSGFLQDFIPMTNYIQERKHGVFSPGDLCSFVLNIFDDGNVVSIVTDVTGHGTHVAGIAAAYNPQEPALNGIAPGAQLISCKIGDTRLSARETGTGLTRALIAVLKHKCDLINMSYGEPCSIPNTGRFIDLVNEVVNRHGVIFVSSAGNSGPALTTVGAPGGTTESVLGVGAYVSPAMAAHAHSVVDPLKSGLTYTWSSRGPSPDGAYGVCVSAPGGAVSSVSQWSLQKRQLMNGTSMSSPAACAGLALLLSKLKTVWPESSPLPIQLVRQAVLNTAVLNPPGEEPDAALKAEKILSMGKGLMQLDSAWKYIDRALSEAASRQQPVALHRYNLRVSNASAGNGCPKRGIYIRESPLSQTVSEWKVTVTPKFPDTLNPDLACRLALEEKIQLSCSEDWIRLPSNILLNHTAKTFSVHVDPTGLLPGAHVAEIQGMDLDSSWRGPLFSLLVTVLKTTPLDTAQESPPRASFPPVKFSPGHVERRFLDVPAGASWAEITVKTSDFDTPLSFLLHTVQLTHLQHPSHGETKTLLAFPCPSERHLAVRVEAGLTLEVALALFWSSGSALKPPAVASLQVSFHGIKSTPTSVVVDGCVGGARVDLETALGTQRVAPIAVLRSVRLCFRPSEAVLSPLSPERDLLPDNRQVHSLLLKYDLSLLEGGRYTPRFPLLQHRQYESGLDSVYYMLLDSSGKVVSQASVYPTAVKLSKGEYSFKLQLRHDNVALLEKLRKLPLIMDRSLADKPISLPLSSSIGDIIAGNSSLRPITMAPHEKQVFYIGGPKEEDLPKDATPGTLLLGRMTLGKVANMEHGVPCPARTYVSYVVPPRPKKSEGQSGSKEAESTTAEQKMQEMMRDAKLKLLGKFPTSTEEEEKEYEKLLSALKAEYPAHIPLLLEDLRHAKASAKKGSKDSKKGKLHEVAVAAGRVMSAVDVNELALWLGVKNNPDDPATETKRKDMEVKREALLESLYEKAIASLELHKMRQSASPCEPASSDSAESTDGTDVEPKAGGQNVSSDSEDLREFERCYAELKKWTEVKDKFVLVEIERDVLHGRPAMALQKLLSAEEARKEKGLKLRDLDDASIQDMKVRLLKELQFCQWADSLQQDWKYPKSYLF